MLHAHHRSNRQLKAQLGRLYATLLADQTLVEEYTAPYAVVPLPYAQSIVLDHVIHRLHYPTHPTH